VSDVVVIGPASLNLIVELDALPDPRPHMVFASDHWRTLGGTSAGKSLHLAALGVPTTVVVAAGADADATHIEAELTSAGVEVLGIHGMGPSEHHLNLMTRAGERLSIYLDAAPTVLPTTADRERVSAALAKARLVALDLAPLGLEFLPEIRSTSLPVWVDLHDYNGTSSFHEPFVAAADVILMNGDAMADPVEFLRSRVAMGAFAGVCTLGADGAVGVAADGEIVRVEAVPVDVVDTNGAGDAFTAGMIATVLSAIAKGPINAALLRSAMVAGAQQATTALASRGLGPA